MEEIRLWRVITEAGKQKAISLEAKKHIDTEEMLEKLLLNSPHLLMENLTIIGRQNETSGGPLDLLGVDEDGRLVVFELKRGSLTRDAVAQALDYASFLAELSEDRLSHFITEHSGSNDVGKIEDFSAWYSDKFHRPAANIGKPKIVLVGVGADERTRRMVEFLAEGGIDISLSTFQAFSEDGQILLAKQVDSREVIDIGSGINSRSANLADLTQLVSKMGMQNEFEDLASKIKKAFGVGAYQWPYKTGFAYSLPVVQADGTKRLRNYLTLYADVAHAKQVRAYLQPLCTAAVGGSIAIVETASKMGSKANVTPTGYISFWFDMMKPKQAEYLCSLVAAIRSGYEKTAPIQEAGQAESSSVTENEVG